LPIVYDLENAFLTDKDKAQTVPDYMGDDSTDLGSLAGNDKAV